jgi:O-antigen/teichoic acid export membrane protein
VGTKLNVAANLVGKAWSGVVGFIFVPVYIRLLGIEAYGLIGFFTSLMALSLAFDLGLSTTINRELARLSASHAPPRDARDLVRSLECIYWITAAILGLLVAVLAPWFAASWLSPHGISVAATTQAIRLMGVVIFLRWPAALYTGGLMGLHRQVLANGLSIVMTTLQSGGAVLALWLISPSLDAFFWAQILAATVQITLLPVLLWRSLPQDGRRPTFSGRALRSIWQFAAGVSGITILSVVLTQADKFLVSKLLPLNEFGYYVLASSIAGIISLPALAMYSAMYPVFSSLVSEHQTDTLSSRYHRSCQTLSILILPPSILLIAFSRELLQYYVHDSNTVENTHRLLSLMAIGNMFLALMALPLAMQFAYGWTRLSLYKNILAVAIYVPAIIFMVRRFEAKGAAMAWIALTLGYFLFEVPLMHRRVLPGEKFKWYFKDVGFTLITSILIVGTARLFVTPALGAVSEALVLVTAVGLAAGVSLIFLHHYG